MRNDAGRRRRALWVVLAVLSAFTACNGSDENGPGSDTTPPVVTTAAAYTVSSAVPLGGTLTVTTNEATTLRVLATNAGDATDTFATATSAAATSHSQRLLGFRPGQTYDLALQLRDAAGNLTTDTSVSVTTAALPAGFPPITLNAPDPGAPGPEPGLLFMDVRSFDAAGGTGDATAYLLAVDGEGAVRWFRQIPEGPYEMRFLANGNLLYISGDTALVEMDLLGNTVREWVSLYDASHGDGQPETIDVALDTFHHDVIELGNGHLLVLSTRRRWVPNYPTAEDPAAGPAGAYIIEDTVAELDPATGAVIKEWSLMSDDAVAGDPGYEVGGYGTTAIVPLLDPTRVGYDSLSGFWATIYPDVNPTYRCTQGAGLNGCYDWSHANGLAFDALNNRILVSLRHQDAVIAFSRGDNGLEWILGNRTGWGTPWASADSGASCTGLGCFLLEPPPGADATLFWQYHQHAPMLTAAGHLLLFDNGNYKAVPADAKLAATANTSRVVEFQVIAETPPYGTPIQSVSRIWDYVRSDLYAPFIGDADEQPASGHVIAHFGGVTKDTAAACAATDTIFTADKFARIVEVTKDPSPLVVFDLTVGDPDCSSLEGWMSFRSMKAPLPDYNP